MWIQLNRNLKSMMNYIIIKQSNNTKINEVKVLRGTGYHLNHYLSKYKTFLPDIELGIVRRKKKIRRRI